MSLGFLIRKSLGIFEKPIAELYRSIFVDLSALANQIHHWVNASNVLTILEVGCGEGAMTEKLVEVYPNAQIIGIDITSRVGRMFQGDFSRVIFKQETIEEFAKNNISQIDLIVINDVMHHIPLSLHESFLQDINKVLKTGGYVILKDWVKSQSVIHFAAYFSDRYITGDRVQYKTENEFKKLIIKVFGKTAIKDKSLIKPWSNNVAFLISSR